VKQRKGRHLANFENLPVTTHVYELSAEQRPCPCCGVERKEIGQEESWQIEHIPGRFERIHHMRKKYACTACESNGDNPCIETAGQVAPVSMIAPTTMRVPPVPRLWGPGMEAPRRPVFPVGVFSQCMKGGR
jgi:hypothetical protein